MPSLDDYIKENQHLLEEDKKPSKSTAKKKDSLIPENVRGPINETVQDVATYPIKALSEFILGKRFGEKSQEKSKQYIEEHPEGAKMIAALAATPFIPEATIPSMIGGGALSGIQSALSGGSISDIAKDTAIGTAGAGVLKGAQAASKPLFKAAGKAISYPLGLINSIPGKDVYEAMSKVAGGKNIFNIGEQTENQVASELASKALKGAAKIRGELGAPVGAAKKALKESAQSGEIATKFDPEESLNTIKDFIEEKTSSVGKTSLGKKELSALQDVRKLLKSSASDPIDQAIVLKEALENKAKDFSDIYGRYSPTGKVLLEIKNNINNQLLSKAPDLADLNKKFAEASSKQTDILKALSNKELRGGKLLTAASQDRPLKEALEYVNEKLPENEKFLEAARDLLLRRKFQPIFPGEGGGFGSAGGYGNLTRAEMTSAARDIAGLPGAIAAKTIQSPRVSQYAIRGIGKAADIYRAAENVGGNKSAAFGSLMGQLFRNKRKYEEQE